MFKTKFQVCAAIAALLLSTLARTPTRAQTEPVKVGVVAVSGLSAVFLAQEEGFFKSHGLNVQFVYFNAALPVATAVVSGAVDFGVTAATAGLFNLAARGELKMIAAAAHEHAGFHLQAYLASKRAFASGLHSVKDLPGHSFAVTGPGGPAAYILGDLVAHKYHFDPKTIRFVPMQTLPNIVTAVAGGRVDATLTSLTPAMFKMIDGQQVKLLGWVGDETPWQYGVVVTSSKISSSNSARVDRFLAAYRDATHAYHSAFVGPGEKPKPDPDPSVLKVLAKYTKQTPQEFAKTIPYFDGQARLDVKDVLRQVAWYEQQGLVRGTVPGEEMLDKRVVRGAASK